MFPLSDFNPESLPLYIMTASAVMFLARYAHAPLTKFLERAVGSRVSERAKEMEALHENQRRLLLDLSHNLQTPLTVLKTQIERLERNLLHDGQAAGLGQSVDALTRFINELMALANLDHSLAREERRTFSLSALMADVCDEIGVITGTSGILFQSAVASDVAFYGNEKRLREAVMNLACNAVKYMGDGPVRRIRLSLEIEEMRGRILIAVTDTGRGIPESELPHVFERFYRGSARTYGSVPGTGLGLSIVERITKEHGGAVTVESTIGTGSAFTLAFPRTESGRLRTSRP